MKLKIICFRTNPLKIKLQYNEILCYIQTSWVVHMFVQVYMNVSGGHRMRILIIIYADDAE